MLGEDSTTGTYFRFAPEEPLSVLSRMVPDAKVMTFGELAPSHLKLVPAKTGIDSMLSKKSTLSKKSSFSSENIAWMLATTS